MAIRADRVGVREDQVDIHGRVTSPSFLNELLDDLPEWTDMPVWVNGTEELLPSNNSVPVTSPILTDIAYPDIRRDNQYFTYRESPTPVDGLAKIKSIKGNTLVWNQISIVPFTETRAGVAFTRSDDRTTLQMSGTSTSTIYKPFSDMPKTTVGHVYYVDKGADSTLFQLYNDNAGIDTELNGRNAIGTATAEKSWYFRIPNGTTIDVTAKPMIIDLTQMLGAGNEPSTVEEFTSLFPLSYYSYNQGSLLSFNGNGIKTVGKNKAYLEQGSLAYNSTGAEISSATRVRTNFIPVEQAVNYVESSENNGWVIKNGCAYDANKNYLGYTEFPSPSTHIYNTNLNGNPFKSQIAYVRFMYGNSTNTNCTPNDYWYQFEKGTTPSSYEPYTSSTLSLPISTYFPTGMKSAGTVYDELIPKKAITKLALFEITSANIQSGYLDTQNNQWLGFVSIPDIKQITDASVKANIICNTLETKNQGSLFGEVGSAIALLINSTNVRITIKGITTFADMQTWLDINPTYFVYELATPVELPTMSFE